MAEQKPSIGRTVQYTLSRLNAEQVNSARITGGELRPGVPVFTGNPASEGDVYPMVIVRVWSDTGVNGQVLLDGNDQLWVTSVGCGEGPGTWRWPERV